MKASRLLLAALALPLLAACTDGAAAGGAPVHEPGYVTGRVVDTRGQPVAGAKILLDNPVFYASYINGSTRDDGRYRIRVQPGAWRAQASLERDYHGRTYTLELHGEDTDSFDEEGAVRDFAWKLEGRTPRSRYGYYGGFIQLSSAIGFHDAFEDIELLLVPDGPLIDGSAGSTLRLRLGDHYWVDRFQVEDIPIGRYTVSATLSGNGRQRPLRIQDWHTQGDFVPRLQLDFLPEPGTGPRNSASIVIGD